MEYIFINEIQIKFMIINFHLIFDKYQMFKISLKAILIELLLDDDKFLEWLSKGTTISKRVQLFENGTTVSKRVHLFKKGTTV